MGWGRMDDRFDEHPKVIAILDHEDPFAAAMAIGTWTMCFTWAHRNTRKRGQVPGLVPPGLPKRYFGRDVRVGIELLVKHGLWDPHESGGWTFHDFQDYLPNEETRDARSEAGKRGAAKRWAGHKKAADANPGQNGNLPSGDGNEPSGDGKAMASGSQTDDNAVASDGSRAPARRAIPKGIAPTPEPAPTPGDQNLDSQTSEDDEADAGDFDDEPDDNPKNDREDIDLVCQHLADRIVANGSKRPTIGKRWRDSARLMIDRDKRSVEQILKAIDWCQDDEFWRANVLSMPKLRKQYDALRLAAQRRRNANGDRRPPINSGANKHNDSQDRRPTITGVRSSDVLAEQAARGDR